MLDPFGKMVQNYLKDLGIELLDEVFVIIPARVSIDSAVQRILWLLDSNTPPNELVDLDKTQGELQDILTFYALLGALAMAPYGLEMELVKSANMRIYKERFNRRLKNITKEKSPSKQIELLNDLLSQLSIDVRAVAKDEIPQRDKVIIERTLWEKQFEKIEAEKMKLKFKIHMKDFFKFIGDNLKKYYIKRGYVYIQSNMLSNAWERSFEFHIERAVVQLYENRDSIFNKYYVELYEKIREISREYFKEKLERMGSAEAQPLRFELFPPCVKIALGGVPAGLRNYAITVLLTSFLSYARLCPSPSRRDVRIRDCVGDLSVVEKEILPVIIEAGNRCSPPLFEDQPHEVKNIWYHLGFGLTDRPTLEDSGNSTWYFPPNCSKIQANAPQLCKPDRHCRNIKNPLTYYLRRLYIESRKGKEEEDAGGSENG